MKSYVESAFSAIESTLYTWDPSSTYIHEPPYFKDMTMSPPDPHPVNKLLKGEVAPKTIHIPTGEKLSVFDAAMRHKSGSSRDWAAKGPMLLGVKAVIAKSFERIPRSNLASMGIIPLCFKAGEDAETLGLTGHERVFRVISKWRIHMGLSVERKF